jgi:NAD(P)-dependent dehydrogenase (short-subunit alcohol dehydrogenase family)
MDVSIASCSLKLRIRTGQETIMQVLKNKKALITGASSGIGQAIALAFAEQGADVVFSYHKNEKGAQELLSQMTALQQNAHAVRAIMSDTQDLQKLVDEAVHFLDGIDILVNNAGTITRHADFLEISTDALDEIMAVNLRAPFILSQLVANQMIQQNRGGSIINISSISAQIPCSGLTHYECSKAGVHTLTRGSASALAKHKIRVNGIAPGLVPSNINRLQREDNPDLWNDRVARIPLGRAGYPEEIADMVVMLASDKSSWTTGAMITIDGGVCVRPT